MRMVALTAMSLVVAACGGVASTGPTDGPDVDPGRQQPDAATPGPGWQPLPSSPLSPRHGATAVWVDGMLVVFGGRDTPACPPTASCVGPTEPPLRDGARFDPATGAWTSIAPLPVDVEYVTTTAAAGTFWAWSTSWSDTGPEAAFLAYEVATDVWTELPLPPAANDLHPSLEVFGDEVVLAQTSHEEGRQPDLRFSPATGQFTELAADPIGPSFDRDLTTVGDRLVLTGVDLVENPGGGSGPALYRSATWTPGDDWVELPPGHVIGYSPEWHAVGGLLVNPMHGGSDGGATNTYDRTHPFGGILDPANGTWSDLPEPPADVDRWSGFGGSIGDQDLLVGPYGLGLRTDPMAWIEIGPPPSGAVDAAAAIVGDGRLWIFGGVAWSDTADGTLSSEAWVFTPA